ncbi:hypothetical protein HMPREF0322_04466 [Desulfitobacterium hafniense DP7]|uniref:Uncharacterized protein n=1 Tax=Desulfitobacterium hafniense DP7 TaxID=537010 RepID=G9XU08_DESHA|nr:hypothetical protein HMPREF0322_04466 [Desulfitobacterium hafniense DP7]
MMLPFLSLFRLKHFQFRMGMPAAAHDKRAAVTYKRHALFLV